MNEASAGIRRSLFYIAITAMLIGITLVESMSRRFFKDAGALADPGMMFNLLLLLVLLGLTVLVVVRAQRIARTESEQWCAPGLDRLLFEHNQAAMLLSSADGRVQRINPAYSRLTGFTENELLGRSDSFQRPGSMDGSLMESMEQNLATAFHWSGEMWLRKTDGEVLSFDVLRIALRDGEGNVPLVLTLCLVNDVTSEPQKLMLWQARHDPLTKLPNANFFEERVRRFLLDDKAEDGAVLSINLDHFTQVNDSSGFGVGDQILMDVANRLAMTVRSQDVVARLGGDQFGVLLRGLSNPGERTRLAGQIVTAIAAPFRVRGRELYLSASVGVQSLSQSTSMASLGASEVLQRAESARVQASRGGGNRVKFYEPLHNARAQARYDLEMALRQALPNEELELHYQPLVDHQAGKVVSFEALLRWNHPKRGVVSPVEFIPLAEETGLIVDIGLWIVRKAQERLRYWKEQGHTDLRLSINISTRQLRDVNDVRTLIKALRVPETQQLTLEITESLMVADKDLYRDFLSQARGLGAKIALDDFGTGYSSLSYLRDYRFDVLKIDRSFVSVLGGEEDTADVRTEAELNQVAVDRNLVASIVQLGEIFDLEVVAEGVEHESELGLLASLGCTLIQGYYFGAPLPWNDAERYLQLANTTGELRRSLQK